MTAAAFLQLAAFQLELMDEVFEIPPAEWRYVEFSLGRQPATVTARFETNARDGVKVGLLRHGDLERLRHELPHGVLAATPRRPRGTLRHAVEAPGRYFIVVDNRAGVAPARVRLRISLDFSAAPRAPVRSLSRGRQAWVVGLSFAVFFGIVFYAGRKLLRGLRR